MMSSPVGTEDVDDNEDDRPVKVQGFLDSHAGFAFKPKRLIEPYLDDRPI